MKDIFKVATVSLVAFFVTSALWVVVADTDPARTALHELVIEHLRQQSSVLTEPLSQYPRTLPVFNAEAIIPPQCYTKTAGKFNPCYVCHQNAIPERENVMNDGGLQLAYSFSDVGMTNHWKNLFEDRSERVAAIGDREIDDWVDADNYSSLAPRLREADFKAWIPDLRNLQLGAAAFDEHGFARDGSGWVAFNYKPLPSTFWPTNGSTDDVMIRLPDAFRKDSNGEESRDVYIANLAILEALIKGFDRISTLKFDERKFGKDLDGDGHLGVATRVEDVSDWVGAAAGRYIDSFVYPEGTEFLHTVRYLGVGANGEISIPRRMKEVRYMKKWKDQFKQAYERGYEIEGFHKDEGRLPNYYMIGDWGLDNGFAWSVQSFIEAADGQLRTASYEENLFCMGCHTSIGATIDKTFSFARKIDGAEGWGYINLHGMADAPNMGESRGEYATYLERVGGGGEFRSNPEMYQRWFNEDGSVNHAALAKAKDVYEIIAPSPERARMLNKAYRTIVQDQDYIYGRDAIVTPPENVYEYIDNETAPTLSADLFYKWDIRLDWPKKTDPMALKRAAR